MDATDGKTRCPWSTSDPLYIRYHDEEWGVPVHNEAKHFEFLILEGAQAGLSWFTILRKREAYRKAYRGFDAGKVARFDEVDVERLLGDDGIVRNRLKIRGSIENAKRFLEVQREFGTFDAYIWNLAGGKTVVNRRKSLNEVPATTPLSDAISRDLKLRGFKFVGSTIIYAHLQAIGIVNDHLVSCFRHRELTKEQKNWPADIDRLTGR